MRKTERLERFSNDPSFRGKGGRIKATERRSNVAGVVCRVIGAKSNGRHADLPLARRLDDVDPPM